MTNLVPYDFCKPYILDDESLLWEGGTERGVRLKSRENVLVPYREV